MRPSYVVFKSETLRECKAWKARIPLRREAHTHTHTLQGYDPQNVLSERTTKDGTTIIKFRDGGAWCLQGVCTCSHSDDVVQVMVVLRFFSAPVL